MTKLCLHKPYIRPTYCLHTFGIFSPLLSISKTNRVAIEPPIWQNRDRHLSYFTIKAVKKFSREFGTYLPI